MKKISGCLFVCFLFLAPQCIGQTGVLKSPDGCIALNFQTGSNLNEPLTYQLNYASSTVVSEGTIQLKCAGHSLQLKKTEQSKKRNRWKTLYGERKFIPENYNQQLLQFRATDDSHLQLTILLRVYNEGFAYQYVITQNREIVITNETSYFGLPAGATAWVSTTAQGLLTEKKISDIRNVVERPLTVRVADSLYLALGEAALVDFPRMKFSATTAGGLTTVLDGEAKASGELRSPWRYVLMATSSASLLEKNYLLLNLNAPGQIKDARWIQPGKVLREVTLTTKGAYQTIDFAAAHNIRYMLFDAGWYGREDHDSSDASKVSLDPLRSKGPLDLKAVINYGKTRNVGIILYVNRHALERQLDSLLPVYHSWGVKGLKFGFVQVGSQQWTSWLHEAIRKCARYQMIVDVHDEYRPTGYSRTYPNLLTQEGIRGDEESPFTEQTITTLFTRMIAGAADNTICYFTPRVDKMGSHTAQMAKAICIYSPLQFLYWYDHPAFGTSATFADGEIQEVPELAWFNAMPTTWDETKVLEGDMRDFATIARKKGSQWFIGSLNGTKPREFQLPLQFLDKEKKYLATIYTHDAQQQTATHVKITTMEVNSKTILHLSVGSRDGAAIRITPLNKK